MKKNPRVRAPETFWTTLWGAPLYATLHQDGRDAIDMLNSMKEAFDKAIAETQDNGIRAELEKSWELAVNRLRNIF